MPTTDDLKQRIEAAIPGSQAQVTDLTGTGDHFRARAVAALDALSATYAAVDILPDPRIRQELSAISNWPTVPQLFVKGELIGGCDIVTEMYETGELAQT